MCPCLPYYAVALRICIRRRRAALVLLHIPVVVFVLILKGRLTYFVISSSMVFVGFPRGELFQEASRGVMDACEALMTGDG